MAGDKDKEEVEDKNWFLKMSTKEKRNKILKQFESPVDFVDRLRGIESENLFSIQLVQNAKDDLNIAEIELKQTLNERKSNEKEL